VHCIINLGLSDHSKKPLCGLKAASSSKPPLLWLKMWISVDATTAISSSTFFLISLLSAERGGKVLDGLLGVLSCFIAIYFSKTSNKPGSQI
jgi:hypothetical protein